MRKYINPDISQWDEIVQRPAIDMTTLFDTVRPIVEAVREEGDDALLRFAQQFDGVALQSVRVSDEELAECESLVMAMPDGEALIKAIHQAEKNIRTFHEAQRFETIKVQTMPGVICSQHSVAIEKVGLYVPGGSAPLLSTVLMLAVPAKIAGCKEIVMCTPPGKDGKVNAALLYAARYCGVTNIYKVGGAGAVAAMALGTESIPKVDKIFGPGNRYVMAAKQWVSLMGVSIDMPAGPSEVEVIADESCNPAFVAADLLSQAEHGPDSQAVLICHSEDVADAVMKEVESQLQQLPRQDIARKALEGSRIVVLTDTDNDKVIALTNLYAPEHLIIATKDYHDIARQITTAGSIFLGNYSCESAGDYASGTNHTLPTMGYARAYSGLSLDSFCRKFTMQEISAEGIANLADCVERMAVAEGLDAHARAMTLRCEAAQAISATPQSPQGEAGCDGLPNDSLTPLLRPNIAALTPYSCARDEFSGGTDDTVFLDANESPYAVAGKLNRYPDPLQRQLKAEISKIKGIPAEQIFLGNGSDEAIDLIFRTLCCPGKDNVVAIDPSYGMYSVCADINDVEYRRVPLNEDFSMSVDAVMTKVDANTKAIFICSPNNPTGNTYRKEIEELLSRKPQCLVVVDEAYADFCEEESVRQFVMTTPNLCVLNTFSKAWASAAVRLGMAFGSKEFIDTMNKVKYPYNVNILTQQYALDLLQNHYEELEEWRQLVVQERERVMEAFSKLDVCRMVYPSKANFFLAKVDDANGMYKYLANEGVIVRNRNNVNLCNGCLRITIGTPEENDVMLEKVMKYV